MGSTRCVLAGALSCALIAGCYDARGSGEGYYPGQCRDEIDNDDDGRADCLDPGCASQCGIAMRPDAGGCPSGTICLSCTEGASCEAGYYCGEDGLCHLLDAPCSSDFDCESGEYCGVQGQCLADCTIGGCPSGYYCGEDRNCHLDDGCITDTDCGAGWYCEGGACYPSTACTSHSDCGSGSYCGWDGICYPDTDASDCISAGCTGDTYCNPADGFCYPSSYCSQDTDCHGSTSICGWDGNCYPQCFGDDCPSGYCCDPTYGYCVACSP